MNKKLVSIIGAVVLLGVISIFVFYRPVVNGIATNYNTASSKKVSNKNGKALIFYYSNSGTTETAAKEIQKRTGADLIKMNISPDYPSNYEELTKVSRKQIDDNSRPKITNNIDMSKYSTIYLGFPTWYHQPPMFINSFFEQYNLNGKTVIPFTTSMSSPIDVSTPFLKKMVQGKYVDL
ncbi:flavodoxin [Lactobacillus terrae]|uniref:flavodoxin n=1 Tax=Lactobacillus terrae TaxID=2269374 RepID=UPI000C1B6266|nr:flavodoxin [Lactobacillus terrae]